MYSSQLDSKAEMDYFGKLRDILKDISKNSSLDDIKSNAEAIYKLIPANYSDKVFEKMNNVRVDVIRKKDIILNFQKVFGKKWTSMFILFILTLILEIGIGIKKVEMVE